MHDAPGMKRWDNFLAIDWSGAMGERHKGIALAIAAGEGGPPVLVDPPKGGWSREEVLALLRDDLPERTLIGADLGISLPFDDAGAYFPGWDRSPGDAKALWALVDEICADDPHLGARSFVSHDEASRYFRHGKGKEGDRFELKDAPSREGRFRITEGAQRAQNCRPVSNFNLVGAAQVGKSSLTGMRMLHRLRGALCVWPIDPLPGPESDASLLVEIYTGLISRETAALGARTKLLTHADLNAGLAVLDCPPIDAVGAIDDHSSDALLSAAWLRAVCDEERRWSPRLLTPQIARREGWTFGAL